jgi:hypothetical protein
MSITTKSKWYYGFYLDNSNKYLNLDEGTGEGTISIVGDYTATGFAQKLQDTLNQDLTLEYTVSFDRETRIFTISANGTFTVLCETGSNVDQSFCSLIGFTDEADAPASSLLSDEVAGFEYVPQFYLQKYIDFADNEESVTSTVNLSADGQNVEVIDYGTQQFMECEIKFANDGLTTASEIDTDANGVANLRSFLSYMRRKRRAEFMPDKDTPSAFTNCILESTDKSQAGTAFQLKEMYGQGLPNYYESGKLKFRKVV